jgi:deoxyribose-phosphate aldolase
MSIQGRIKDLVPVSLAQAVEYTDLRKEITYADVERLCYKAVVHKFAAVVVPSALVKLAATYLKDSPVRVATVIAYPYGTESLEAKVCEIETALVDGANELDVVPHFGAIRAGRWDVVEKELKAVRRAAADRTLKLVLEAQCLSKEELDHLVKIAAAMGFQFVVNATGFRLVSTKPETAGRASPELVSSLVKIGASQIRVKAAGGIREVADAQALIVAGATRVAIIAEAGVLRAPNA